MDPEGSLFRLSALNRVSNYNRPRRLALGCLFCAVAFAQMPLKNAGFEEGKPGGPPTGWFVGNQGVYKTEIASTDCFSGKQCVVLRSDNAASDSFGTIAQTFDATPYRGKSFRFRAAVRTEVSGAQNRAQLWLRVDCQDGHTGFFNNMQDRPITDSAWKSYDITGTVDADAARIALGLILAGSGRAWIDEASFEILDPPRPLTTRGLENLQALARLLGYVRYFHPSDAAASADWNQLAMDAVQAVEGASNAQELAARLAAIFSFVPPTIRVFPTGSTPAPLEFNLAPNIVEWRHHGVGLSEGPTYYSERITRVPGGPLPTFHADLPGGVTCLVPLALYTDRTSSYRLKPPSEKPSGSAEQRATRLAAVIIAWNVFQHFYPYFDVVDTDWPKALTMALSSAATDRTGAEFLGTLRRMVAALHDGHGRVTWAGATTAPSPVGWDWVEGRLVITDVPDPRGQPIEPGDVVVAIDGKPVAETLGEAEGQISAATAQWLMARALGTGLHYDQPLGAIGEGPPSQPLVLELEPWRHPGTSRKVTIDRRVSRKPVREPRPAPISDLGSGILYVDLTRITDQDWQTSLDRMQAASGLVLDLRGYPKLAGFLPYLSQMPMASEQFHNPVVTRPDRTDMRFERSGEWKLPPATPYLKAKKVFLTDGRAISAAETYMGIVEYYHLGAIVGGPTAGTNGGTNPFSVPGGYQITWTGTKVLKHDGSRHHGVGISPTVPASRTIAGIATGKDEVLDRALELLQ